MDTVELFQRLSLALAIGLLIGIERAWQAREDAEGERAVGLRTLALSGLLGGIWAATAQAFGEGGGAVMASGFVVFAATIVLFRYRETVRDGTLGATTAIASLLTFALGAYALVGNKGAAAASGVAVAGLLAFKSVLHGWVKRLSWIELRSALVLLAMTFLALPVLPHDPIDPWGAIKPFEIWLLTVMIALISFAGYVAIKLAGGRYGVALTAFGGGLTSSTAVTLTFARLARDNAGQARLLAGGALLSGAVMLVRVLVMAGAVEPALIARLALPLAFAIVVIGLGAALLMLRGPTGTAGAPDMEIANPLDLPSVLKFGALLVVIGLATKVAVHTAGNAGAYVLAALSGIGDVDAITLSMARLSGMSVEESVAAGAILIVVTTNTLAKAAMAWTTGGRRMGSLMLLVGGAAAAAGLVGYALGPIAWPGAPPA